MSPYPLDMLIPVLQPAGWHDPLRGIVFAGVFPWVSSPILVVVAALGGFLLAAFLTRWPPQHKLARVEAILAELRESERQLRESESWYRALFECTKDAVMLLDENSFFDCNNATLTLFGCASRDEFIACHPSELSTTLQPDGRDSREAADEKIAAALRLGSCNFEWRHQRVDGAPFMADVFLSRIEQHGRRVVLAVVRDISERKQFEEALRIASQNALEANQAKTAFLANVSHELRTPLHGILSFAAFGMRRTELLGEPDIHEYFELIRRSGHTLLALVNDLLDLSKFETGQAELVRTRVEMNTLILRVIDECQSRAAKVPVTVRLVGSENETPLFCDEARITQVLRNLINNAIKFSEEGNTILITVAREDNHMTISVTDHGIGIPEDELERIFDKFFRSSKTRYDHGGTGLGLAICREIVESHGGRIWAESRLGGGTSVLFRIPVIEPHPATSATTSLAAPLIDPAANGPATMVPT